MRTPTFTAKRALGLTLAGALAVGGSFGLAGSAEAAAAQYKTASASTSAGQIVTVNGTNFTNDNGVPLFNSTKVLFQTAACATTTPGSGTGATVSIVSDTQLRVTTPAAGSVPLTSSKPTKYNICFYKPGAGAALLGTTAVTVYAVPTFTAAIDTSAGPSYGGTKITVTGQDFTSKTGITVGGVAATNVKATLGKTSSDDDIVVGYTPSSSSTTAQAVKITGEFGTVAYVNGGTPQNFTYNNAIKVSPSGSDGNQRVITVNGSGFNDLTFGTGGTIAVGTSSAYKSWVALVPGSVPTADGTAGTADSGWFAGASSVYALPTGVQTCTSVDVISDSQLTCVTPNLSAAATQGSYQVKVITLSDAHVITADSTDTSRGSSYTVAPF